MPYPKLDFISYHDQKLGITLPEVMTPALAELLGIMTGDGCVCCASHHRRSMTICGDKRYEKEYYRDCVVPLIKQIFNINPIIRQSRRSNTLYLIVNSKGVFNYFIKAGFPLGKKRQIAIPESIQADKELLIAFIRGLADTDGSFHARYGTYPIISFASISKPLMAGLFVALSDLGFNLMNYYHERKYDKRSGQKSAIYRVFLYGKYNFKLWQELIGFHNPKHIKKIQKYGFVGI